MTLHDAAVVDTNAIAALKLYDPAELPGMMLVTAVTLGELSFGPHATDDPVKHAGASPSCSTSRRPSTRFRMVRVLLGSSVRSARRSGRPGASLVSAPRT